MSAKPMTREGELLRRAQKYLLDVQECPDCGAGADPELGRVQRRHHDDGCGLLALLDDIKALNADRREKGGE